MKYNRPIVTNASVSRAIRIQNVLHAHVGYSHTYPAYVNF